jgi:hypothetical protein
MSTGDEAVIVVQLSGVAEYDTLREVVNQLAGLLVARQRAAAPADADGWRLEHRALRDGLDQIQPGTPEAGAALREWSRRLAELRQAGP